MYPIFRYSPRLKANCITEMSVAVKLACAVWNSAVTAKNRIAAAFITVAEILRKNMMYINSIAD